MSRITHSVFFKLKHAKGSTAESKFLTAARELAKIPAVENFQCLKQTSPKNDFDFGLSMEFETEDDYRQYNDHPSHQDFVAKRWIPEVESFMEIDYTPL